MADIVLGFDTADEYVANSHILCAVIGRYANRIAQGAFPSRARLSLPKNNGEKPCTVGPTALQRAVEGKADRQRC